MSVWNWIQRFAEYPIYKRKRVTAFIIDKTVLKNGNQHFLVMALYQPIHSSVLRMSKKRNMLVAEKFIRSLVEKYGRHAVYTDGEGMMKPAIY